ncbi:MAG: PAS domain S-box protein [Deltaproteobacteria bacterium]|nr:PAS domain S-box protein [Deltaproteobacteria bacterium]
MSKESNTRLLSILEALQDGIYIVNEDFTVEYMNRAMRAHWAGHEGTKCYEVLSGLDQPCPWCRAREIFDQGEAVQWEYHSPDETRIFEVTELPLAGPDGKMSKLAIFRDVTSFRKQEERLRVTEQDYTRLFENVSSGVYISSKRGRFLDANPALLRMLGYETKEEFLNIDIRKDLYLNPEDRDRFQQMIEKEGRVVDWEVDFKRKDGTPIHILLTAHGRRDPSGQILGYEGIMVDQTQRRAMAEKLREANDFLNKLIASSPNAIMAADMRGNILIWNHAAEEILGYAAEEVVGKMNIVEIWPDGMARDIMKMIRSPEYGGEGRLRSYPLVAHRRDGSLLEANFSAAVIYDAEGNEAASVGILVDLKERLSMERKLRKTQEQLLQSEKLAAMGRLTSQIAHELNNPLYGIMNTLELLKTEISPDNRRRKVLDMALSETERLSTLLKKMLTFSRPDQEERQKVSLNEVVDEILLLHEKQLRENDIKIVQDLDASCPLVMASKNQLRQVFLNMVSNAQDAMPEGGVLTVKSGVHDGKAAVWVSDTGVGMREDVKAHIFDAFFTTKDAIKGVGLGLSVCYGFIKEHGGDITVQSAPGEGTTFLITLPPAP